MTAVQKMIVTLERAAGIISAYQIIAKSMKFLTFPRISVSVMKIPNTVLCKNNASLRRIAACTLTVNQITAVSQQASWQCSVLQEAINNASQCIQTGMNLSLSRECGMM